MSTRCNIVISDQYSKIILYRHSDGYPDCVGVDLKDFVKGYTDGSMRDDAMQSAGWLIIRGHVEYADGNPTLKPNPKDRFGGWKVGAYEPTSNIHGDIEYLYEIDLVKMELRIRQGHTLRSKVIETISFAKQSEVQS